MNLLHALHQLLGAHTQTPAQPHQQQTQSPSAGGVWEDGSGVNLGQINPYQSGQGIPLTKQMGGMTFPNRQGKQWEDGSLSMGPQGPVPVNRDVAHFQGGLPQQGFGQQVQGIGGLNVHGNVQGGAQVPWQNFGPQRPNMVNPQVRDNGYNIL